MSTALDKMKNNCSSAWKAVLVSLFALVSVYGCGGGESTSSNPNLGAPIVVGYTGPAPATADVQAFKINVWDNLSATNRCGSCHVAGGQSPQFVRQDDVNLAYSAANSVVNGQLVINLAAPDQSLMVTKVRNGHQCWLADNNICADTIQGYIEAWGNGTSTTSKEIVLEAPTVLRDPGASKSFPTDSSLFASTIHPVLLAHCAGCHSETSTNKQSPFFANSDPDSAYNNAKQKINIDSPGDSRFVVRLCDLNVPPSDPLDTNTNCQGHNSWSGDFRADANVMLTAIQNFANGITPTQIDPSLVISKLMRVEDGIVSAGGARHEANLIALWEFKTKQGNIAYDTSNIEPATHLNLFGEYNWLGSYGIQFINGAAQASAADARKLHDLIKSTGEYSIEAWVVPENVAQSDRNIISYSSNATSRNFAMKQTQYNYEFYNRSESSINLGNGTPFLTTDPNDEDLQATLQHVVMTYKVGEGRKIYVNGQDTGDTDPVAYGLLTDWSNNYAFILGNEVGSYRADDMNNSAWKGSVRLVAIHNRALTPAQIQQNFDAGVGEKYYLLFSISHLISVPDSYILMEVTQFDNYSFQFSKPTYVNLGTNPTIGSIPVKGLRIGINGKEAAVGQGYINVDTTITTNNQVLSDLGTIIPLEKGFTDDFFLSFEVLGSNSHVYVEADPPTPAAPADSEDVSDIGVRTFDEVNQTMSALTGVPFNNTNIMNKFNSLKQQLPSKETFIGFVSAHSIGISQLAFEYCNELVEDSTLRANFFGAAPYNFNSFDQNVSTAFGTGLSTQKQAVVNALYDRMIGIPATATDNATVLSTTITRAQLMTELVDPANAPAGDPFAIPSTSTNAGNLFDRLMRSCSEGSVSCTTAQGTKDFVKAMCTAVLGSAVTLVQ